MKHLLLSALLALLSLPLLAQPVSEAVARQQAQAFLQQRGKVLTSPSRMKMAAQRRRAVSADSPSDYYVFNVGADEGFVIVGGDSRAAGILGYADQGTFSPDAMPDGLRFLLDCYAEEVASLGDAPVAAAAHQAPAYVARRAVAPLINTRWNQGAPYNHLCPTSGEVQTVTGCVATAMAQVMRFHSWPTSATTAIPGYTTRSLKIALDALPSTTFAWSAMTDTYAAEYTETAAEKAVATLMQYCGWSLQMNYNVNSKGGSSSYNAAIPGALQSHFGYSAAYAQRQFYDYADWVALIYGEVSSGRPVVLGGQSIGGGHSFVCDGYDTDDLFHINWGWGGSSDGYFRLSALNPYVQGIGGSSTLDGFSFTQDAVVGIQPHAGSVAPTRLSLEKLQFDDTGATAPQVLTRSSADDAFTRLALYFSLWNYSYINTSYDYKFVLTNGSTEHELYSYVGNGSETFSFNTNVSATLTNLSTPAALADGTYFIKVFSRLNGQTDWQECYGSPQLQLTAVVEGNTMTVTAPIVFGPKTLPTGVTFTVDGNLTKGYEQTVIASVTCGASGYHGNLVLGVNGAPMMGKTVDIPAGQTVDVRFTYIPSTVGDNVLTLWTSKKSKEEVGGSQIPGSATVTILGSDATDDLELTFAVHIDNQNTDGKLYGNGFRATVTVTNPSEANTYVGTLSCSARQWTKTETESEGEGGSTIITTTWNWKSLDLTSYPLTVAKGGTTVIHVSNDNLPADGLYSFRVTYKRTNGDQKVADAVHVGLVNDGVEHGSLAMTSGYRLGDATGAVTLHEASSTIDAGSACFVDLRNLPSLSGVTVTPGTNPNCLYLLADEATAPGSLSRCNVVCGNTASTLTLVDGHDFYSPIAFTAEEAAYTRTFGLAASGTAGWNTLMLPFTATTVTVHQADGTDSKRTWFRSDTDEEGSFWLRAFAADAQGTVTFDYADALTANTPYIIAVPGTTWGTAWQMTGLPVTFSGTKVNVSATADAAVSGNNYKFRGTTVGTSVSDAYVLNATGSSFARTATATAMPAFSAWFEPVSISSLTLPALSIGNPGATGLRNLAAKGRTLSADAWVTLDGRRLSTAPTRPGLYIRNGKTIVVK